jgi:hypothetical protein
MMLLYETIQVVLIGLALGWWCKNPCMGLVRLPQQCKDDHLVSTIHILTTLDYINYLHMINTSSPTIIRN